MIFIDKETKQDPVARWNLPDKTFFAAGACQVLAYAFIERFSRFGFRAVWIRPAEGFRGNHIVSSNGMYVFDYQGIERYADYFASLHSEMSERARNDGSFEGWSYELLEFPVECLVSEKKSKALGLWLRQPDQFLHDAIPRARRFVDEYEDQVLALVQP
ncbi:MAG: hypothetical protein ACOC8L_14335 [Spirochaetota bacterium]